MPQHRQQHGRGGTQQYGRGGGTQQYGRGGGTQQYGHGGDHGGAQQYGHGGMPHQGSRPQLHPGMPLAFPPSHGSPSHGSPSHVPPQQCHDMARAQIYQGQSEHTQLRYNGDSLYTVTDDMTMWEHLIGPDDYVRTPNGARFSNIHQRIKHFLDILEFTGSDYSRKAILDFFGIDNFDQPCLDASIYRDKFKAKLQGMCTCPEEYDRNVRIFPRVCIAAIWCGSAHYLTRDDKIDPRASDKYCKEGMDTDTSQWQNVLEKIWAAVSNKRIPRKRSTEDLPHAPHPEGVPLVGDSHMMSFQFPEILAMFAYIHAFILKFGEDRVNSKYIKALYGEMRANPIMSTCVDLFLSTVDIWAPEHADVLACGMMGTSMVYITGNTKGNTLQGNAVDVIRYKQTHSGLDVPRTYDELFHIMYDPEYAVRWWAFPNKDAIKYSDVYGLGPVLESQLSDNHDMFYYMRWSFVYLINGWAFNNVLLTHVINKPLNGVSQRVKQTARAHIDKIRIASRPEMHMPGPPRQPAPYHGPPMPAPLHGPPSQPAHQHVRQMPAQQHVPPMQPASDDHQPVCLYTVEFPPLRRP